MTDKDIEEIVFKCVGNADVDLDFGDCDEDTYYELGQEAYRRSNIRSDIYEYFLTAGFSEDDYNQHENAIETVMQDAIDDEINRAILYHEH